jgi:hypothetical protein
MMILFLGVLAVNITINASKIDILWFVIGALVLVIELLTTIIISIAVYEVMLPMPPHTNKRGFKLLSRFVRLLAKLLVNKVE